MSLLVERVCAIINSSNNVVAGGTRHTPAVMIRRLRGGLTMSDTIPENFVQCTFDFDALSVDDIVPPINSIPYQKPSRRTYRKQVEGEIVQANNKRKSDQLGMPFGTAVHRLRKSIVFHLLQKHGENVCFVCNEIIDTVDELSYEHKVPWQGNSNDLFWDLDNIAFSHLRCNRPHEEINKKKLAPPGKTWCNGCEDFISTDLFYAERRRLKKIRSRCKKCVSDAARRKYKESKSR
jgi:hypothetical protein